MDYRRNNDHRRRSRSRSRDSPNKRREERYHRDDRRTRESSPNRNRRSRSPEHGRSGRREIRTTNNSEQQSRTNLASLPPKGNIREVSTVIAETSKPSESISVEPEVQYNESDMCDIQNFLVADEGDEDAKEARLMEERKRRRAEIMLKHEPKLAENIHTVNFENDDDEFILTKSNGQALYNADDAECIQLAAEKAAKEADMAIRQRDNLEFDMFNASPTEDDRMLLAAHRGERGTAGVLPAPDAGDDNPHLQSNWDDEGGYYKPRIGEIIADRYRTLQVVGKGMFSNVVKCADLRAMAAADQEDRVAVPVAIKIIRNNDVMRKAAEKEFSILQAIMNKDPDNKRYCVKLVSHFEYRSHQLFIFEFQPMNLREALNKFGKNVGINIRAVRLYGKQLLVALRLLMELKIIHADIKLDNILCSGDLKQVKLCDFGSGFFEDEPDDLHAKGRVYLVSRFYRAPEISLAMPVYDRSLDFWSICVCLYELFTGHLMFPGANNNDMIRLIMAVKGRPPIKMIKTHIKSFEKMERDPFFDADMKFRQQAIDPVTGCAVVKMVDVPLQPTKDLTSILRSSKAGADDGKLVASFADLLDKGINIDPSKRLTVAEALKHPFFSMK